MLSSMQYGYGLVVLPLRREPKYSQITLFRSAKKNADGQVTDVSVSAGTLQKIVGGTNK